MSNSTARMNTRSKNAAVHPGLVDVLPKRPRAVGQTKKEAAKEKKEANEIGVKNQELLTPNHLPLTPKKESIIEPCIETDIPNVKEEKIRIVFFKFNIAKLHKIAIIIS